jgi:hypothetical protein
MVEEKLWGKELQHPPLTIGEVGKLNDDDTAAVQGTFYVGV